MLAHLIDSKAHLELADGWATKISSIIRDDFVLDDAWATEHITLEDAASHRTGLPRHEKAWARVVNGSQATVRDVVRNLRNLRLNHEPRTVFQYCNLMYVVLGHVVEAITGKALDRAMRDAIWGPLAMNSTRLASDDAPQTPGRVATGYYWDDQAGVYKRAPPMSFTEVGGAGAVISSVLDYARWIECLLHEAPPFSERVHADFKRLRMLAGPAVSAGLDMSLYGLGWERTLYRGHVIYTHSGGLDAFGCQVYWLPDARFGAVAFANTGVTSNAVEDVVIYRLEDRLGIPEHQRFDFDKKYCPIHSPLRRAWLANLVTRWQDAIDRATRPVENVAKFLFPNHPTPPMPSTFKTKDLVGTYWGLGYGEFTLRLEPSTDGHADEMLVAERDMTWRYRLRLQYVSGDYWIVYASTPRNPTFINEFHPGEFTRGVDGKVSGLEIRWLSRDGTDEGTFFRKRS